MQDIELLEAVIDDISARHSIDADRVYAVGVSIGSIFSYEIACGHTSRFTAIASYAGTMRDILGLVQYWRQKYRCRNETETVSDSAAHFVYDDCDENAQVEHYRLENQDHNWPEDINGVSTHEVIWSFLSNYAMPQHAKEL